LLAKVIAGNFSALKKSSERRCASRPASFVVMLGPLTC
jgi:hypothetical protein